MSRSKGAGLGAIILIAGILMVGAMFAVPIFSSIDNSADMTGDQYEQEYDGAVSMTQFATQSMLPLVAVVFGIGALIYAGRQLF